MNKGIESKYRNFLDFSDLDSGELRRILDISGKFKQNRSGIDHKHGPLEGKILAMVFEQPSTRTRISFDLAMRELGGQTITLTGSEMQLGRGETIADTARVMSRYIDAIMIRILDNNALKELAEFSSVPVINGLTKKFHPCQIMADILTFEEVKGPIKGRTIAWSGDSNNVLNSWIQAAQKLEFELRIATPAKFHPDPEIVRLAKENGANIVLTQDPAEAVQGSDCILTDNWASLGDDATADRHELFQPFQVNKVLMAKAKPDAIFMHCLPAHRGEEVTDEVIDSAQSVVFDEAENRLHVQKGILAWCLDCIPGNS